MSLNQSISVPTIPEFYNVSHVLGQGNRAAQWLLSASILVCGNNGRSTTQGTTTAHARMYAPIRAGTRGGQGDFK